MIRLRSMPRRYVHDLPQRWPVYAPTNGNGMQLTQVIAEKEKKSTSYKEGNLDSLSDEKVVKIKKFAKEYIAKVLRKLEKSGQRSKGPASASSTTTLSVADTPNSANGVDAMSVDDVMGMHEDPGHGSGDDNDMDDEDDQLKEPADYLPPEFVHTSSSQAAIDDPMDVLVSPTVKADTTDPRSRPPNGNGLTNGVIHHEDALTTKSFMPNIDTLNGFSPPSAVGASPADAISPNPLPFSKDSYAPEVRMLPPFEVPQLWLKDPLFSNRPFLAEVRGSRASDDCCGSEHEGRRGYIESVVDATATFVYQESAALQKKARVPIRLLVPVPPSRTRDIVVPLEGAHKGEALTVREWGVDHCAVHDRDDIVTLDIPTDHLATLHQDSTLAS
jgi:hypothetical protein